jgi:hypothetical protein
LDVGHGIDAIIQPNDENPLPGEPIWVRVLDVVEQPVRPHGEYDAFERDTALLA